MVTVKLGSRSLFLKRKGFLGENLHVIARFTEAFLIRRNFANFVKSFVKQAMLI